MSVPVIMPKVDMDQEKGTIISWEKNEGDLVKIEETLLVVETEKVAIDIPSPASGVLAGIMFNDGDVVPVATVIAYILLEGESIDSIVRTEPVVSDVKIDTKLVGKPIKTSVAASPLAIKAAKELGINLEDVPVSGNRMSIEDVKNYVNSLKVGRIDETINKNDKISATPAARKKAQQTGAVLSEILGSGPRGRIQSVDVEKHSCISKGDVQIDQSYFVVPLVGKRLTIAKKLQSSFQEAPHFSISVDTDMTAIENLRQALKNRYPEEKITLTAMLVWGTSRALTQNPILNSSINGEDIRIWKHVNMGIATAIDEGLIVPVIHGADLLDVREIAHQVNTLGKKARDGKLSLSDVQNGTFTITNLGMYAIPRFHAVINPPEAGILAAGAIVRKPVVINESDKIEVRPMMSLTLSADHRILDGASAAKFMNDLKLGLENPALILI